MEISRFNFSVMIFTAVLVPAPTAFAEGDPERGKRAFVKCVICHSVEPNVNKTGPSLARILGAKAGVAGGFGRYSVALRSSGIVWNDMTLDSWLRDPLSLVPGTSMKIRGISNAAERRNIIAYLKKLGSSGSTDQASVPNRNSSRSGGMMGASEPTDISKPLSGQQVTSLRYCRDTYEVTTAEGKTRKFWEFNLRFKTDSSDKGPPKGKPVLLRAGMMGGDRSFVIFNNPKEISGFIKEKC